MIKEAAVLVLTYHKDHDHHLVLTKRTEQVEHHKGQICFPGGVKDEKDCDLWETALRETKEELGVNPDQVTFLGKLNQVITPTEFRITPYVASLVCLLPWQPNPTEINQVFSISFSHLYNPQNFCLQKKVYSGVEYDDPLFTYGEHHIWGATGRIIVDLLEKWKSFLK